VDLRRDFRPLVAKGRSAILVDPSRHPPRPDPGARTVIDALKSDEIVQRLGGRFKLTALIQRRLGELVDGARPLVERNGRTDFEVVIDEIVQEKITIDWEASGLEQPARR
jgi:DNA-directed RNA polymerase subunit omega